MRSSFEIGRAESQVMPVTAEAGDHVQVDVHHILPGRASIRQEQVDSLTFDLAFPQSGIHLLGDFEHMSCRFLIQLGYQFGMPDRDHQHMPGLTGWMSMKAAHR